MNTSKTIQTVLAIAIAAACSWATAQDAALYQPQALPNTLTLDSQNIVSMGAEVDLIIKGPEDFYLRESFGAGEPVEIIPAVLNENYLPDGTYRYELQIMGIQGMSSERSSDDVGGTESLGGGFGSFSIEGGSGTFSIEGGQVVPSNAVEAPYKASHSTNGKVASTDDWVTEEDQVIADDAIIMSSLCVGMDCINGESFGFDTIRLKENNLRIKFDDTSSSGSFPNHDWQLTANDSANGGLNKFSIEDITAGRIPFTVEGSAPSNSLYIDSTGRVGLGTSTPVLEAHISNGDSPGLRLEQNGSSGFAAQTWDIAGNEANFFVRDVTNGSKLPFKIKPGAPDNSIFIAADGDVGMGSASPSAKLHVTGSNGSTSLKIEETSGTVADRALLTMTNNGGGRIFFDDNSASGNDWVTATTGSDIFRISKVGSGGTEFELDGAGNLTLSGTLTTASNVYPDYVFKDGYALMPIMEVEAFILQNGHLPNIRPADEIIRDGLDLTEGYVKLMEKVEELTLYTIEQQKLIDELRSRLDELEDS